MSAEDEGDVSMRIAAAIVGGVGPDRDREQVVLAAGGLAREDLDDLDATLTTAAEEAMWRAALRATGDPELGLRAAARLERGAFGALEYAVRSCATLTQGMQVLARFAGLLHGAPMFRFASDPGGGGALTLIEAHAHDAELSVVTGDFALGAVLLIARDAAGATLPVEQARLGRPPPVSSRSHQELFGPVVVFGADGWSLRFGADALATPMRQADPRLRRVLEGFLSRELAEHDESEPFLRRLRAVIQAGLAKDAFAVGDIAAAVELSERTLQRRLSELDTSFSEQLDLVRRDLAQELLRRPELSVMGAALMLGYSDATAFHRAFRRWTGTTPGRYRRA